MKRILVLCMLCVPGLWLSALADQATEKGKSTATAAPSGPAQPEITNEKPMSFWMSMKLEYAKKILESLTSGDFEGLSNGAEEMQFVGKIEGFVRQRNPTYAKQLRTFDLANQELVRQADRKNIEGATLAFNQLTSSCVACHVQIREAKLGGVHPEPEEVEK